MSKLITQACAFCHFSVRPGTQATILTIFEDDVLLYNFLWANNHEFKPWLGPACIRKLNMVLCHR